MYFVGIHLKFAFTRQSSPNICKSHSLSTQHLINSRYTIRLYAIMINNNTRQRSWICHGSWLIIVKYGAWYNVKITRDTLSQFAFLTTLLLPKDIYLKTVNITLCLLVAELRSNGRNQWFGNGNISYQNRLNIVVNLPQLLHHHHNASTCSNNMAMAATNWILGGQWQPIRHFLVIVSEMIVILDVLCVAWINIEMLQKVYGNLYISIK